MYQHLYMLLLSNIVTSAVLKYDTEQPTTVIEIYSVIYMQVLYIYNVYSTLKKSYNIYFCWFCDRVWCLLICLCIDISKSAVCSTAAAVTMVDVKCAVLKCFT